MRSKSALLGAVVCGLMSLPATLSAQNSSINTFSPYSFYGLGDFSIQGTANLRAMGGAGVAYREGTSINYLNPASLSGIRRQSALFDIGFEGQNFYLKTTDKKSSFNTFNVRDVAFAVPVAAKLGLGFSITPYSSVGYRIQDQETMLPIGQINYYYDGEGDITQAKLSVGYEPLKHLSIGAEMIYYFGTISRSSTAELIPLDGSLSYKSPVFTTSERVSRIFANFGAQYNILFREKNSAMTIGATYQPKGKLNPRITKSIPTSDGTTDFGEYAFYDHYLDKDFSLPSTAAVGVYYHNTKLSVGADYVYQPWKGLNTKAENADLKFRNTSTVKAGVSFTPDRGSVRNYFKRITYRVGARYSDYYMQLRGQDISDKALTLGIGLPLRLNGLSNINLGVELGQRGTTRNNLVKENYFKFSVGLSLFGDDFWFVKPKYD